VFTNGSATTWTEAAVRQILDPALVNTISATVGGSPVVANAVSQEVFQAVVASRAARSFIVIMTDDEGLTVQPGMPHLAYTTTSNETPTLVIAFERSAADYLFELRAGGMSAGQTARLAVDYANEEAEISFDGSASAPTFEIYFERVTETGVRDVQTYRCRSDAKRDPLRCVRRMDRRWRCGLGRL